MLDNQKMLNTEKTVSISASAIIIVSIYVAAQMLADIGSLKVALVAGFSVDAGTFIYPITFTLRDLIHKKLGKKAALVTILTCGGINLVMALYFAFVTWLPADNTWLFQTAWETILGPVWRIVFASIIAEVVSEVIDTEAYHLWTKYVTQKKQWSRVLVSNLISIPVDSFIFSFIAFGGSLPNEVVWGIFFSNCIIKVVVTLVSLPLIYVVK